VAHTQVVKVGIHIPVEVVLAYTDPREPVVLAGPVVEVAMLFARTGAAVPEAVLGVHPVVVDNRHLVVKTGDSHNLEELKLVAD